MKYARIDKSEQGDHLNMNMYLNRIRENSIFILIFFLLFLTLFLSSTLCHSMGRLSAKVTPAPVQPPSTIEPTEEASFHPEVIAEDFSQEGNVSGSQEFPPWSEVSSSGNHPEPKLPPNKKKPLPRIKIDPPFQAALTPLKNPSDQIFTRRELPRFTAWESRLPEWISLESFPEPYFELAQELYKNSGELQKKYSSFQHYLISLCADSSMPFDPEPSSQTPLHMDATLEALGALWAVQNNLIPGPIERTLASNWLIDHHRVLWDVITPTFESLHLSDQDGTSLARGVFTIDPLITRIRNFLALNQKFRNRQLSSRVLLNLGLLSPKQERIVALELLTHLKSNQFKLVSFIRFNPNHSFRAY
jgi:hypothetical protein